MSEITKFFVVKITATSPLFLSNHIEKVLLKNRYNISPCMDGDSFTSIEVVEVDPKVWPLT